jgi:hypothetical protein
VSEPSKFWLAELDDELHECHLPQLRRGLVHTCECGCIWEALLGFTGRAYGLRWALTRDPDGRVGR